MIGNALNQILSNYKLHVIKEDEVIELDMCVSANGEILFNVDKDEINSNMAFCIKGEESEVLVEGQLKPVTDNIDYFRQYASYYPNMDSTKHLMMLKPTKIIIGDESYDATEFDLVNAFAGEVENRMVEHMNDDHVDAIIDYCKFAGVKLGNADPSMLGVDQRGFDLLVDDKPVRFMFEKVCTTPVEVREALVDLAKRSRA